MMLATPLTSTEFSTLRRFRTGKVRDVYDLGDALLIVATDRISAFDYVLGSGIPDKGKVLTQLSVFWFAQLAGVVPNHFITTDVAKYPAATQAYAADLTGRSMLVRKTAPIDVECVARGYLAGSGWKEYQQTGRVCGVPLPGGLVESDRLPAPIFTPATKASTGHDINISEAEAARHLGNAALVERLRTLTLELYRRASAHAESRGIILADTKFEFGYVDSADELILADEVLTPDSSRFWPADAVVPGATPPSFDKQPLRDWLEAQGWDKQPPPPHLPPEIVTATRQRYVEAYERITGLSFDAWPGVGR